MHSNPEMRKLEEGLSAALNVALFRLDQMEDKNSRIGLGDYDYLPSTVNLSQVLIKKLRLLVGEGRTE